MPRVRGCMSQHSVSYHPRMPTNGATIETGVLPTRHPYARIGTGARVVLSIPMLSLTHEPAKPGSVRWLWKLGVQRQGQGPQAAYVQLLGYREDVWRVTAQPCHAVAACACLTQNRSKGTE